jgi:hypothetical protein
LCATTRRHSVRIYSSYELVVAFEDRRLVFVALDLVVLVRKRQETRRVVGFVRQHLLEVFYLPSKLCSFR